MSDREKRRQMDDARIVVYTAARLLLDGPRDDIAWSLLRRDLERLRVATDAYYADVEPATASLPAREEK